MFKFHVLDGGILGDKRTVPLDTIPPHQQVVHETLFNKIAVEL
jgi:hypothetical protein